MAEQQLTSCFSILDKAHNWNIQDHGINAQYDLLFPKFTTFLNYSKTSHEKAFLISADLSPTLFDNTWCDISSQSVNQLFGKFTKTADGLKFTPANFNQHKRLCISSAKLLSDSKLADCLFTSLFNGIFNSSNLIDDHASAELVVAEHLQAPFATQLTIYGSNHELNELLHFYPLLNQIVDHKIHETDLAVETSEQVLGQLLSHIRLHYCPAITVKQLPYVCWALSRQVEDQNWLSLDHHYLKALFNHLNAEFELSDVEEAVKHITGFYSHAKQFNYDQLLRGAIKVDTSGQVVGQINGLTVVETDTAEFGEPSRITANVYLGDGDIGDIERKSDLGGNIHAKAMMILSSYVSRTFAQNAPMPVSANIVFEQSYHEVDGDSASLAELYALLSALAKVKVNQNVAVTGAMDQLGNVLVVGGLDLKIESFYDIAKALSPNETHTVLIPKGNLAHINLSQRVVDAIKQGTFKIVAISHVKQASDYLLNLPAEADEQDNLFDKVRDSLDRFESDVETHPPLRQKIWQLLKLSRN
ncbi:hypothetical protein C2869_14790 [Saccharobesus litoralis]|uniref:endopeptidase La n=1 Tax=Saccharobesus litoralis TaxID=2172099 RepID=A0A2S0VTT1_9ALTE|nr:S16 family serine protease [Saccharobesus litoralis]AWB67626.1 hypothetical protein C2869_14790 [Saccharobesus litoralis]